MLSCHGARHFSRQNRESPSRQATHRTSFTRLIFTPPTLPLTRNKFFDDFVVYVMYPSCRAPSPPCLHSAKEGKRLRKTKRHPAQPVSLWHAPCCCSMADELISCFVLPFFAAGAIDSFDQADRLPRRIPPEAGGGDPPTGVTNLLSGQASRTLPFILSAISQPAMTSRRHPWAFIGPESLGLWRQITARTLQATDAQQLVGHPEQQGRPTQSLRRRYLVLR